MSLHGYADKLHDALIATDEGMIKSLEYEIYARMNGESEIFIIGNGGSCANAQHIAGDYTKSFALLGLGIRVSCPADSICFYSAAANDLSFAETFEMLVGSRIRKGDLVIMLSGSGNSMNLVRTARACQAKGIKTAGITGYLGGLLKELTDIAIHTPVEDMEVAEDCQIAIAHYIKQSLHSKLAGEGFRILETDKCQKRIGEGLVA